MDTIIDKNEEIINTLREIYYQAKPEQLRDLIAKHFIPTQEEKKGNAEIPTPVKLVDEMLDKINLDFWKSPKKVFEPCCGKGNFVLGIFDRFYIGLEEMYPNKDERCRIIMTDCIYYADLSALNVFITTEILKCHVEFIPSFDGNNRLLFDCDYDDLFNKNVGNTLELDIMEKWKLKGFDAVIGNPPYNSNGDTSTGNTIWQYFTKQSLNKWLCNNGLLLFIHPPGWRKPNTKKGKFYGMFEDMTKKHQMVYLEIHGIKDGQKIFKCGTRYDWYLIENTPIYKNTIVIDENNIYNKIDMNLFKWLPNFNIDLIFNIITLNEYEKNIIIYSPSLYEHRKNWMSHIKTDEFKYVCVHSTPKSGIRYMYSKFNDKGHFGISKVIFGESGINDVIVDMDGKYGLTNGAIGIKINDLQTGNNISKALKSNKFSNIIESCLFSSYRIDWNIFKEFKKDFYKDFIND